MIMRYLGKGIRHRGQLPCRRLFDFSDSDRWWPRAASDAACSPNSALPVEHGGDSDAERSDDLQDFSNDEGSDTEENPVDDL